MRRTILLRSFCYCFYFLVALFITFMFVGYNAGLVKYAQNPRNAELGLLRGIVEGTGGRSVLAADHEFTIRTAKIGKRIVAAA